MTVLYMPESFSYFYNHTKIISKPQYTWDYIHKLQKIILTQKCILNSNTTKTEIAHHNKNYGSRQPRIVHRLTVAMPHS